MPDVSITRRATGMVTLRGDLADAALAEAVRAATGCPVPDRRRIALEGESAAAWMAPDELMLFTLPGHGPGTANALGRALAVSHHLAADVSDARVIFRLSGRGTRVLLAKGAPVDLVAEAFGPGDFRRTRLGQVAAAVWCREPDVFELMCFRSVGGFVADWLANAAHPGSLVGHT